MRFASIVNGSLDLIARKAIERAKHLNLQFGLDTVIKIVYVI